MTTSPAPDKCVKRNVTKGELTSEQCSAVHCIDLRAQVHKVIEASQEMDDADST